MTDIDYKGEGAQIVEIAPFATKFKNRQRIFSTSLSSLFVFWKENLASCGIHDVTLELWAIEPDVNTCSPKRTAKKVMAPFVMLMSLEIWKAMNG
jgi:hypothetical protein